MSEVRLPICPICKEEILLPFSVSQVGSKTFAHWICTNCGFYIGTGDTRGVNPESDIEAHFNHKLATRMKKLKKLYQT